MADTPTAIAKNQLRFFTTSEDYFSVLAESLPRAKKQILIVGWSFDDRVVMNRGNGHPHPSIGDLLLEHAASHPEILIQLRIWDAPPVFGADQYLSQSFHKKALATENLDLQFIPSDSTFAARHEKYVLIDSAIAFLGGIDVTHDRWDSADHQADKPERTNPDEDSYIPYHDVQVAMSGPIVGALWNVALEDGLVEQIPQTTHALWPSGLPVDARDATISLARTRLDPDTEKPSVTEISDSYLELIQQAKKRIYIENQYFSSTAVTDAIVERIHDEAGPEIIIIMAKELPEAFGRMTMGANSSMQLSRLLKEDTHEKVAFYSRVSSDDPDATVKIHSKLMIVDSRFISLGSANISRRSFGMDSELNVIIDAEQCDNTRLAQELETRLCAQHCGLSTEEWTQLAHAHDGSVSAALKTRAVDWPGLTAGKQSLNLSMIPPDLLEALDMGKPPVAESTLQGHFRSNPGGISKRMKQAFLVVLVLGLIAGAAVFFARANVDIEVILEEVRAIHRARPVLGSALTIGSFWLSMTVFVSILVPVVFFAALHGPPLGILFSVIGLLSGAAIYYRLGLLVFDAVWIDKFKAVRSAKEQLERIKPYGVWAVAISRMVPSGPFAIVNFATGMLGFTFRQFLFGSLIGLIPGIIAFSIFGEIIQNVFTDPGWVNFGLLVGFLILYFAFARLILKLIQKIAGWVSQPGDV